MDFEQEWLVEFHTEKSLSNSITQRNEFQSKYMFYISWKLRYIRGKRLAYSSP